MQVTLTLLLLMTGVGLVGRAIRSYWANTESAPGMGAGIVFGQWWFAAALLFGLSILVHPTLHWGWALASLVGCALLNIPAKVLLLVVFGRIRRTPVNGRRDR